MSSDVSNPLCSFPLLLSRPCFFFSHLVVLLGGVLLGLARWHGCVALDEGGHDLAGRLNAQAQGRHIHEQQVLRGLAAHAAENGALDGSTVGDGLIGVDLAAQLLALWLSNVCVCV